MTYKTTVNWLLNDTWCYLFICCFDWKISVFQQTAVRVISLMSFDHSTSNCMKSLLIICSKSAKITPKQYSGVILIRLFFWIKLFKVFIPLKERSLEFFLTLLFQWKIWWKLRTTWRLISANVIRCSRLRLWVSYFLF